MLIRHIFFPFTKDVRLGTIVFDVFGMEMLAGVEGILEVRSVVELRESDRSRWPLGGEPDSGGQPPD